MHLLILNSVLCGARDFLIVDRPQPDGEPDATATATATRKLRVAVALWPLALALALALIPPKSRRSYNPPAWSPHN